MLQLSIKQDTLQEQHTYLISFYQSLPVSFICKDLIFLAECYIKHSLKALSQLLMLSDHNLKLCVCLLSYTLVISTKLLPRMFWSFSSQLFLAYAYE